MTGAPKSGLRANVGMISERPEDVLPEVQIRARGHVEEVRAEEPVHHQEGQPDGDDGEREHDEELHDQAHPHEERHAHQRHARRAHVHDRHGEVDARDHRRDAEHLQPEDPEVDADPGAERPRGEVRVAEPAAVRRRADDEAQVKEDAAREEDPVGERVQARERDVARADHQRDHVVEEHRVQRHDREEDHGRAVHREERVVELRADDVLLGQRELQPDEQRLDSADQQEDERRDAVEDADALVVDGREPRDHARLGGKGDGRRVRVDEPRRHHFSARR
jgi:hypothetical protein